MFLGRADDQVKLGGRRIELGEVDNALLGLSGVLGAAAAVRRSTAGNSSLVGYLTVDAGFVLGEALERLRQQFPAALVPRLAVVASLRTRTSGKVDRDALPWPLPGGTDDAAAPVVLQGNEAWTCRPTAGRDRGGGEVTRRQLLRPRWRQPDRRADRVPSAGHPEVTVADLYKNPTVGSLAAALDQMAVPAKRSRRRVRPTPLKTQVGQLELMVRSAQSLVCDA